METLRALARAYGARGIRLRLGHELRKRNGWYASAPAMHPPTVLSPPVFGVDLDALATVTGHDAVERGARVRAGEFQAFGHGWRRIPTGPAWQAHPLTGAAYPDVPWYRVRHVDRSVGDIKDTWEPARFGWCYDLIRAYAATRDASFANAFWQYTEDFLSSNPPYRGVQWSCGQETAIRTVALLWGEVVFGPTGSEQQRRRLSAAIFTAGERVANALGYAVAQRNNHGLWESIGLAAVGARFQFFSPTARSWLQRGLLEFSRGISDQFEVDGWYIQHSFTYARVALQASTVAGIVSRVTGRSLPSTVKRRIAGAARLLALMHDEGCGDVPNHGANDGANPLPFSPAPYRDFRAALTGVAIGLDIDVDAPFRPDRVVEAWLGSRVRIGGRRSEMVIGPSGWVVTRCGRTFVFVRAGRYRSRPGDFDALHVDIWHDGRPVAIDAGTFRYVGNPPWNDGLRGAATHNTIDFPDHPIARRGPGFLWIGAPAADVIDARRADDRAVIHLRNESWAARGVRHDRHVEIEDGIVVITDIVTAHARTRARLHWLLEPGTSPPSVDASIPLEREIVIGDASSVRGWRSLYYGHREPAPSVIFTGTLGEGPAIIRSKFALNRTAVTANRHEFPSEQ